MEDRTIDIIDRQGQTANGSCLQGDSLVKKLLLRATPVKIVVVIKDIIPLGKKLYPTDTLTQAQTILTLWERIDLSLTFHNLSIATLNTNVVKVQGLREKILSLQHELLMLRNERDATCIEIWQQVKKARAGIKSVYGDDSTEYQLAGGTRLSDRKRPRRKVTSTAK